MTIPGQPPANNFVMQGVPSYQPNEFNFDLGGSNQAIGDLLGTSQYDSNGQLLKTGLQNFNPTIEDNGFNWGSMQGWGQMLGGLGEVGSAYMAYKNYGLAKDQFKFSKAYANQNLENQTMLVNSQLRSQNRARNRLGGGDRQTTQLNYKPIG